MDVPRNATNLILRAYLIDASGDPITGIAFDDAALSIESLADGDAAFQPVELVAGTVGTFVASSWAEIGGGLYQFCPANTLIVEGRGTVIRVTYGANPPIPGVINAVGSYDAAAIRSAVGQFGADITSRMPVTAAGEIEALTRGDDYLASLARDLSWTVPLPGVDTSGATCHFGGRAGAGSWLVAGTVSRDGDDVTMSFDLPSAATLNLDPGIYHWTVELRSATGKRMTQIRGSVPLEDSQTT